MKKLLLLLSLVLAVGMLSVGCSSELDRCMDKKAEQMFDSSVKELKKYGHQTRVNMIEYECNKQGIY